LAAQRCICFSCQSGIKVTIKKGFSSKNDDFDSKCFFVQKLSTAFGFFSSKIQFLSRDKLYVYSQYLNRQYCRILIPGVVCPQFIWRLCIY
jgi:hypothetical protein